LKSNEVIAILQSIVVIPSLLCTQSFICHGGAAPHTDRHTDNKTEKIRHKNISFGYPRRQTTYQN